MPGCAIIGFDFSPRGARLPFEKLEQCDAWTPFALNGCDSRGLFLHECCLVAIFCPINNNSLFICLTEKLLFTGQNVAECAK